MISATFGDKIALSADGSRDPDANQLTYKWWTYNEAGSRSAGPQLVITDPQHVVLTVPLPTSSYPGQTVEREVHVVLEVWDNGTPSLVGYRRAVISLKP
jgi:hypothetical protein